MINIENVNKKKTNNSNESKLNNFVNVEDYNSESTNVDDKDNSIYEEDLIIDKTNLIINNILNVLTLLIKDSDELEKNLMENMSFSQFQFYNIFNSNKTPKISLKNYLLRILKHSEIEINTLIASVIYLDYICNKNVHNAEFIIVMNLLDPNNKERPNRKILMNTNYNKIGVNCYKIDEKNNVYCFYLIFGDDKIKEI